MRKIYVLLWALLLISLNAFAQVYSENFDGTGAAVTSGVFSSGTGQPTLDANLSIANNWTGYDNSGNLTTASDVVNFCSTGKGLRGYAIPVAGSARRFKLVLTVAAGYTFNMTSISYKHTSNINNGGSQVNVNNGGYGGNSQILQSCPGQTVTLTQALSLTGQITIELVAINSGSINNAEFVFDDFIINGSVMGPPATHLHFDGTNDNVSFGNSINTTLDPLNTITVEAWVKPELNTGLAVIVGNYSSPLSQMQFLLRREATSYTFWLNDGSYKSVSAPANTVVLNTWQHVVGVWNGLDIKIYVDGVLKATTIGVTGASFATTTNNMIIGTNSVPEVFKGSIDEVRIWSTAQTADDIARRRFCELAGTESGLIRYYKFNQGFDASTNTSVTSLTDATTNANNGTLTGFTLTGSTSNWLAGSPVTTGSTIPTAPSVSTPVTYCQNATASALTATGTSLKWYTAATGGLGSTTAPTPSTTTVGTTSYWVTSSNANGCESARAKIDVTLNAKPTVSITGTNAICVGATTTLSPTTGGTWLSSNTAFATVTNAGVVTGVASGVPTFTFTQTSTGCASLPTAAVTVNAKPTVSITGANPICIGATTTLSPTTGGTWASSNTAFATVTNAGLATGVASGAPTFTFTQTSTGCASLPTAAVTVNAKPTVSIAGANAICVGATTTLSPTTGGTWLSSNTTFATVTNAGVVTGVASGALTFTFTQTSTGCASLATAAVTINAIPSAPSVSNVTYAQGAIASALTATGTSLLWYTASTGGTGSATAPTPSTATVGTTSYWVSQTVSTCESPRAKIDVVVALPATHLNFDGVNDYVSIGNILTPSYSKEAWIYCTNTSLANNIISGGPGEAQHAFWAPSGQLFAGHNGDVGGGSWNYVQDPSLLTANTWYHVAVTYDATTTTMKLYKNGVLVSSNSTVPAFINGNMTRIGAYGNATSLFGGNIEDVRIWNTALSADDIARRKNCELQGNEAGLVSYYKFNQGINTVTNTSVTTLTDATANANNGTLNGFALTGATSNWLAGSPVTTGSTIPTTPSVSTPVTYCQNATASALTATGTSLLWYTAATGGTGSSTAPTPSTTTTGTTSYWVTSSNANGCESARAKIDVITADCNEIHTGSTSCYTATLTNVQGNSWFNFISPSGIIASLNPNGINLGTVTVEVSDASGAVTFNSKKFLGRSVNFMSSNYTSGAAMPSNYSLRLYYMDSELTEYNTATSGTYTLPDFNMMWEQGGTGCSLPTYGGNLEGMVAKANVVEAEYGTGNNGFYLELPLNHFTIFAATTSTNTVLPLELVSFNGYAKNNNNILEWRTEAEQNFSHFELQHSLNGRDFDAMGQIKAKGQGSTYAYTHQNPTATTHYYRLKMVDNDGTSKLSQVISLNKNETKSLRIYPNPTKNSIQIITSDYTQPMRLYSVNGTLMMQKNQTAETLDVSALPTGMYFLHVGSDVLKVIKE